MTEDAIGCPPINVPAAIAAIRAKLEALDAASAVCSARCQPVPAEISAILARLDAMDRATDLMHEEYSRVPTALDRRAAQLEQMIEERHQMLQKQLDTLQKFADSRDEAIRRASNEIRDIFAERFRAVDLRFSERDLRFAQIDVDHQKAIEAALTAVNNASEKNERNFTKQIDNMTLAMNTSTQSTAGRIDDLKERVATKEGAGTGMSSMIGWVVAAIMALAAITGAIVAVTNISHAPMGH